MNIKSPNRKTNNFVRNLNKYFEGIKLMPRKLHLYTEAVTIFGCFVGGWNTAKTDHNLKNIFNMTKI